MNEKGLRVGWCAIIQDVASKLPDKIGRRTYDISTCVFMEAQPYQSMDVWPFTLLPVNIVKISPLESLNLDDLETLVFRGFDMEQCCLHVSIDDELRARCAGVGIAAAEAGEIRLQQSCFTLRRQQSHFDGIVHQLRRIAKYVHRGFESVHRNKPLSH